MKVKTVAILGTAAGVATVAAVAGMLATRRPGEVITAYRVVAGEDGWTVRTDGTESPAGTYGTKREAVTAARKLAAENAPSHLVIQRTDGTVQARHAYGLDGD